MTVLAGCGHQVEQLRPLPPAPFAYLTLAACKAYSSNIVECQLEYGTHFGRHRLGPVQNRGLSIGLDGGRYQVESCYSVDRIQRELPNFVCRISVATSGTDAGSVLIKGGTAVRLARILGDREQLQYRWTPDKWSRLND
ncbi:hypothetical protein O9X90_25250 [Agrobacterium leguminum]|uniref:hypothetical protein n=1 Tax=Agrobacterium TaxID=357 RepID=UPI001574B064|nr:MULTISPECIES: hypothetical protein [Agrobacterium]MCZ7935638.1 hypothetical protein [Agrobacterium leguminum]MCZ7977208.1 hypothetical protein [Agrobacterium salinitolerans]NTA35556.1 hypothetical protein [Agrobacterium salinitolerans]